MHLTKYFYNTVTKECQYFVYSGCGGNANNFMTTVECETTCKKVSAVLIQAPAGSESSGKNATTQQTTKTTPTSTGASSTTTAPAAYSSQQPTASVSQSPTNTANTVTVGAVPSPVNYLQTSPVASNTNTTTPPMQSAQSSPVPSGTYQPTGSVMKTISTVTPSMAMTERPENTSTSSTTFNLPGSKRTFPGTQEQHLGVTRDFVSNGEDCKNTQHGCCDDGNSPAVGANKDGCPERKLLLTHFDKSNGYAMKCSFGDDGFLCIVRLITCSCFYMRLMAWLWGYLFGDGRIY